MSKQMTRQQTKQDRRRERREEQRRQEEARRRAVRTRRAIIIGVIAALVLAVGASVYYYAIAPAQRQAGGSTASTTDSTQPGAAVDGVGCDQQEQTLFHIHAHLTIYINGQQVQVPQNVGIESSGSCLYWLHTHNTDGIIHIESPQQRQYTLGNFLDVWEKQFSQLQYPTELDQTNGWIVYVDGKLYSGNFRDIPLKAHTLITLAFQSPKAQPDTTYSWGNL